MARDRTPDAFGGDVAVQRPLAYQPGREARNGSPVLGSSEDALGRGPHAPQESRPGSGVAIHPAGEAVCDPGVGVSPGREERQRPPSPRIDRDAADPEEHLILGDGTCDRHGRRRPRGSDDRALSCRSAPPTGPARHAYHELVLARSSFDPVPDDADSLELEPPEPSNDGMRCLVIRAQRCEPPCRLAPVCGCSMGAVSARRVRFAYVHGLHASLRMTSTRSQKIMFASRRWSRNPNGAAPTNDPR